MSHVLIIHRVADYAAWKAVFDAAAGIRRSAGETRYRLLRRDDDPNVVVHFSEWTSHAAARGFFASPELVEIRRRAGVEAPEFHYLDEVEAAVLSADRADES